MRSTRQLVPAGAVQGCSLFGGFAGGGLQTACAWGCRGVVWTPCLSYSTAGALQQLMTNLAAVGVVSKVTNQCLQALVVHVQQLPSVLVYGSPPRWAVPHALLSSMLSSLPCSCLSLQRSPHKLVVHTPSCLDLNLPSPLLSPGTMHLIR